jgi:predicted nucleic acid-binding protein
LTKQDLKGRLSVDASALIELVYCEIPGLKLKEALKNNLVEAWTTELAIAELKYILCRKLGWHESSKRTSDLLASGYLKVQDTERLINEAAKLKCQRGISLPDCFTIALAQDIGGDALFARNDQDLTTEMKKRPFEVEILFLED